jgi:hypothetical protein
MLVVELERDGIPAPLALSVALPSVFVEDGLGGHKKAGRQIPDGEREHFLMGGRLGRRL